MKVLVIAHSVRDAEMLIAELRRNGHDPDWQHVGDESALRAVLMAEPWEVVISDYGMRHLTSARSLEILHECDVDVPFLIVSNSVGEEEAVVAMKAGASDFITKDRLRRLAPAIERELRDAEVRRQRAAAERDRLRAEATIVHMACHDGSTGLLNRIGIQNRLDELTQSGASRRPLALVVLSVDHFEGLQDLLGPDNAELLMNAVGNRVLDHVGRQYAAGRIGDSDFAFVVPDVESDQATDFGRQVMASLQSLFTISDVPVELGPSVGISLFPKHAPSPDRLIRAALLAVRHARKTGCGITVFRQEYDPNDAKSLLLLPELRRAVSSRAFSLRYQPEIDLARRRVACVEALVRWRHPRLGPIPPSRFVALAERYGLIHDVTQWVIEQACRESPAWLRAHEGIALAVNLSGRELHDPMLLDRVRAAAEPAGLPLERLQFEVTEAALMSDPRRAREVIDRLGSEGIRFAVDDFGTGFSSFGYLRTLSVRTLKIDKSLIKSVATSDRDAALVGGIIDLGHKLGLDVVAEAVEDEATLEALQSMNCDLVQGFHITRPMSAPALEGWLAHSPWNCSRVDNGSG